MNKIAKIIKIIKNNFSLIFVICASFFCISTIIYAAYTDTNYVPKTVTVHENPGLLFTSNYLEEIVGSNIVLKTYSVPTTDHFEELEDPKFYVYLRNYNTNDKTTYISGNFEYTLEAQLVNADFQAITAAERAALVSNGAAYTFNGFDLVNGVGLVNGIYSVTGTLSGDAARENAYAVVIDKEHLNDPKCFIKVTATPTTEFPNTRTISAILGLSWEYVAKDPSWSGRFTDTATDPKDLDGFNYVISGNGTGTGTLTWDASYLELDLYTISEYHLDTPVVTDGKASLTLSLDDEVCSKYKLRFHRKGTIDDNEAWGGNKSSLLKGAQPILEFSYSS